jgi:hypothetical protein
MREKYIFFIVSSNIYIICMYKKLMCQLMLELFYLLKIQFLYKLRNLISVNRIFIKDYKVSVSF